MVSIQEGFSSKIARVRCKKGKFDYQYQLKQQEMQSLDIVYLILRYNMELFHELDPRSIDFISKKKEIYK